MSPKIASTKYDEPVVRGASECPVESWLAFLGHRWNACILWHLHEAPLRYGELAGRLEGASPKVLSDRLEALVSKGIVERRPVATFPRSVSYSLTPAGRELLEIVRLLEGWSKKSRADHIVPI